MFGKGGTISCWDGWLLDSVMTAIGGHAWVILAKVQGRHVPYLNLVALGKHVWSLLDNKFIYLRILPEVRMYFHGRGIFLDSIFQSILTAQY